MTVLQIVGGGQMGSAICAGLIKSGWALPKSLSVVEVSEQGRESLASALPGVSILREPAPSVDTLIAVKPHLVGLVCAQLVSPGRVMSVAAGITTNQMEAALPSGTSVIRVMPNTPSLVGLGASGFAPGSAAVEGDSIWANEILSAFGVAIEVTEDQLDAVTGLSGSGPAYIFMIAEAMVDGAVAAGLPRQAALTLANQTLLGAATMLIETDLPASELRAAVTTPGGTTASGLRALEDAGLRSGIISAVVAAAERSAELGRNSR